MMILLAFGTIGIVFNVEPVRATNPIIYINADGSISPSGEPVSSLDNIT